jgi:hypothetical protein
LTNAEGQRAWSRYDLRMRARWNLGRVLTEMEREQGAPP